MSPALNSAAFLFASFALGIGGKGALTLLNRTFDHSEPPALLPGDPSALDQMLTWLGFVMLGAAALYHFPGLHPALPSPSWAANSGFIGFMLLGLAKVIHKVATQIEVEEGIDWKALGLFALGATFAAYQETEFLDKLLR